MAFALMARNIKYFHLKRGASEKNLLRPLFMHGSTHECQQKFNDTVSVINAFLKNIKKSKVE
jgi:hypothetical protein